MSAFSWKALQAELSTSSYLLPDDDITSQRGIIATAMAIADRMTCSEAMTVRRLDGLQGHCRTYNSYMEPDMTNFFVGKPSNNCSCKPLM
jgi:hypothetical protein